MKAVTDPIQSTKKPKVQYYTTDTQQNIQHPTNYYYKNSYPTYHTPNTKNYYLSVMPSQHPQISQKQDTDSYHQHRSPNSGNNHHHTHKPNQHNEQQPFYMKIAQRMHDGVQSGFDIFIRPIMEAGKTLSQNLGFRPSANLFGIGKSLDVSAANENASNEGEILSSDFNVAIDNIDDESENKVRRKRGKIVPSVHRNRRALDIDNYESSNDGGNQLNESENNASIRMKQLIRNTDWTNTNCAKRVFCEVMVQQSPDDIAIMEKKMLNILPK